MHGVRRELVEAQAEVAGIPLWDVDLPSPCSNADYESIMGEACRAAVRKGIECVAFGDLFLRDIREYRERQLEGSGLTPIHHLIRLRVQHTLCYWDADSCLSDLTLRPKQPRKRYPIDSLSLVLRLRPRFYAVFST